MVKDDKITFSIIIGEIGNFGGLLMGFSMPSVVEIIYYITLFFLSWGMLASKNNRVGNIKTAEEEINRDCSVSIPWLLLQLLKEYLGYVS